MSMLRTLVAISALATAAGCSATEPPAEGLPVELVDSWLEQGLYDCTQRTDTGYVDGNAFTITVVTVDGKPVELSTANVYIKMQEAAAGAGVGLRIVSGFRTMAEQQYFYDCFIHCNCNDCNLAAEPGTSAHQSGHALDLNTATGGVLAWLNANAGGYGFARTVSSEPWHWEYWGGGPEIGPCGAAPECLQDPNYGGCSGSQITRCENNQIATGDCGAYGAACSTLGGAPHCVHFMCWSNLEGGEDGSFCVDGSEKIGTCALGVLSEGDCAAYGARCSEAGGSAHCVHFLCWSNLDGAEDGRFCRDGEIAGSCALGQYSETACAAAGQVCRDGACVAAGDSTVPTVDAGAGGDAGAAIGDDAAAASGDAGGTAGDTGGTPAADAGSDPLAAPGGQADPLRAERIELGQGAGCRALSVAPAPWLGALLAVGLLRRRR